MTKEDLEDEEIRISPMMEQWHSCKKNAKDAVLLFRMGDFYEAFYEDAEVLSNDLDLTLTKRQGIPMAGVPWHTAETYIDRLIQKGHKIAIAEQIEDPKKAKGLVKRAIVRFVTPGTLINSSFLSEKTNNYILSLTQVGAFFGLAFCDVTTGEFKVIEFEDERELINEIFRLRPAEILVSKKFQEKKEALFQELFLIYQPLVTRQEDLLFEHKIAYHALSTHFQLSHLDGFGLKGMVAAINAAGALVIYLKEELQIPVTHLTRLIPYSTSEHLMIDRITHRNLELTESLLDGSRKNTLLDVIDRTQTPMGARLLRQWLKHPLLCIDSIRARQESLESFLVAPVAAKKAAHLLKGVKDIERILMKISSGFASPKDLVALGSSLEQIAPLREALAPLKSALLEENQLKLVDLKDLIALLKKALVDDPPLRLHEGKIFRAGYSAKLDELREIATNGKNWLALYQNELREKLGIKTLKVNFNKIFGYYIEVSKGQAHLMPNTFNRKQTLVNSERFISPELKEYEHKVLTAEEKIASLEEQLFHELKQEILKDTETIVQIAGAIALTDALLSLAETARLYNYTRPVVDNGERIEITDGRHPVLEVVRSAAFIPNDTALDGENNRLMLITGPNMAGKSTYIRQVALIVILAQMGAFVPARKAHIGVVDKIFTRIGVSDDLSRGQSTFMVEMSETAHILHNATSRSLVILDEIGRGTSTYDGVAIAWSVAEHLLTTPNRTPKTLFATHYWELTGLEETHPGAINYTVAIQENNGNIVFLHKIKRGSTDRSYGVHVARLAGLPFPVITRAQEILNLLEQSGLRRPKIIGKREKKNEKEVQLLLF